MAKAQKKAAKKPVKKTVKKAVKPAKKTAVKKPAVKKIMVKTVHPTALPNRKMFAMEITLLDKIQAELFEAIAQKPAVMDFEETRLFVDNVYMTMNKCVTIAKDVKNMILNKDFKEPITETYNSPA